MGPGHGTTPLLLPFIIYFLLALQAKAVYYPVREYSGSTFFDGWDFYGNVDNTTWGNVTYVNQTTAVSQGLAYVNSAGNAIMKVDNTTTIAPAPIVNRNSIRITSQDTVGAGNIILIDVKHIPYGCSVWPSFWTLGTGLWPNGGEIDIIEAINLMSNNQYALHTVGGCTLNTTGAQLTGKVYGTDCSTGSGCVIAETKPNSYGAGFAQAGGGVWATQLDVTGIYMWFWSRADIPESITSATSNSTIDPSTWGAPSASYPATTCNYAQFFTPQQLVFTTTLCGVWAGVPNIYKGSCHTATGSCVNDCVIGPGSPTFDNAYWEVTYLRTYIAAGSQPSSPNSTTRASGTATARTGSSSTGTANSSSASASVMKWYGLSVGVSVSVVLVFAGLIPAMLA